MAGVTSEAASPGGEGSSLPRLVLRVQWDAHVVFKKPSLGQWKATYCRPAPLSLVLLVDNPDSPLPGPFPRDVMNWPFQE